MIKFKLTDGSYGYANPHLVTSVEQRANGVLICFVDGYLTVDEPMEKVVNTIRPWVMNAHAMKEDK